MLHHILNKIVDSTGTVLDQAALDYLDTMVYGMFDSPAYWVKVRETAADTETAVPLGTIVGAAPAVALSDYNKVEAVKGCSLAKYILGSADTRLDALAYSASNNYVAKQFEVIEAGLNRNNTFVTPNISKEAGVSFEYANNAGSAFQYKKGLEDPKTTAWARDITGIPEQTIKDLADMYWTCGQNGDPIYNEWSGGQLKQAEGCMTLFAIQCLLIVTKNWGIQGTGIANNTIGVSKKTDPKQISDGQVTPTGWGTVPGMANHPKPSVTQWHNALKFAFTEPLAANGYVPRNTIPDYDATKVAIGTKEVYFDDGGVKALIDWGAIPGGTVEEFDAAGGGKYYKWKGWTDANATLPTGADIANTATLSGFRFIFNSAGNIPVNQHANSVDSTEMFKNLPTFGYGTNPAAEMKDGFYLVTMDNFMSPSARYSDYVLPGKTTWEQEDFVGIENSGTLFVDSVIPGPGESMATFDFGREWIKAYAGEGKATQFSGIDANSTFKDYVQKVYNENVKTDAASPYSGKSWEQFLEKPISHATPNLAVPASPAARHAIRSAMDTYLAGDKQLPFMPNVTSVDATAASGVYGFNGGDFASPEKCPQQSKRFHVFSGSLVWRYEHLFDKWHGYLPVAKQGQSNNDKDGNPVVWPIPMYFDYQDYFREAYGLATVAGLADYPFLMTTTHDRFRAHSSQSENPYLRELTHRTIGGELYSGNDRNTYAISSNPEGDMDKFFNINSLIGADGLPLNAVASKKASYTDIWMNPEDAALQGFKDGDLVLVENPIGKVYCTIRTTTRCVRNYVGLHQGCWFDARKINGQTVDVGGNCNTLMASRPSRADHGNAQQSAMVKITKVQG